MSADRTDVLGVLGWGLRRYWLVFLGCVVVGAVLAPALALQQQAPAEAEALVITERLDMELEALPRYAEAIFDNGAVTQAVATQFGDLGDYEDVIPDRISLVAEQDSIVFRVIGHDADPQVASDLANVAANAFIQELNFTGVGVGAFALQSPAQPPAAPITELGSRFALPVGLASGVLLGLTATSVILIARRPAIGPADAEEATGVQALGTVSVPRTRPGAVPRPEECPGLVPVCRRLLTLPTPTLVLVSRPSLDPVRKQLAAATASALSHACDVRFIDASGGEAVLAREDRAAVDRGAQQRGTSITLVDTSDPLDVTEPQQTTTVLVVPEGIGSGALRAAVAEHLGGSAEARLLLVRQTRRSHDESARDGRAVQDQRGAESVALAADRG